MFTPGKSMEGSDWENPWQDKWRHSRESTRPKKSEKVVIAGKQERKKVGRKKEVW